MRPARSKTRPQSSTFRSQMYWSNILGAISRTSQRILQHLRLKERRFTDRMKSVETIAAERLSIQQSRIRYNQEQHLLLWGLISIYNQFVCDKCLEYVEYEGSWVIPNQHPRNSCLSVEWEFCLLCCPTREVALNFHRQLLKETIKNPTILRPL